MNMAPLPVLFFIRPVSDLLFTERRYNYRKLQSMKEAASLAPVKDQQMAETVPLKGGDKP